MPEANIHIVILFFQFIKFIFK